MTVILEYFGYSTGVCLLKCCDLNSAWVLPGGFTFKVLPLQPLRGRS